MANPVLNLPPTWASPEEFECAIAEVKLGDGYDLISPIGTIGETETWQIESSLLNYNQAIAYKSLFEQLTGARAFDWSPAGVSPRNAYVCTEWRLSKVSVGYWRLTAKFEGLRG